MKQELSNLNNPGLLETFTTDFYFDYSCVDASKFKLPRHVASEEGACPPPPTLFREDVKN